MRHAGQHAFATKEPLHDRQRRRRLLRTGQDVERRVPGFIKDAQSALIRAEQGLELLGHVAHVRQTLVLAVAVQGCIARVILHTNVSIIQNARDGRRVVRADQM